MTVNEFLKIVTKDSEVAEYNQDVTIQTYGNRITLAHGKARGLLYINDIEGVVSGLQKFIIVEIERMPKSSGITGIRLPAYNRPYLLLVQ